MPLTLYFTLWDKDTPTLPMLFQQSNIKMFYYTYGNQGRKAIDMKSSGRDELAREPWIHQKCLLEMAQSALHNRSCQSGARRDT